MFCLTPFMHISTIIADGHTDLNGMNLSSGDISSMIFKPLVREDLGDFSLDRQSLVVFMELDGKTNLKTLAQKAGLNLGTMREVVSGLLQLGLVEKVEKDFVPVDRAFLDHLAQQLSLAIGPIAQVLIEDELYNFGYDPDQFPVHRVKELIDKLADEIRRDEKRSDFMASMTKKIQQKSYA